VNILARSPYRLPALKIAIGVTGALLLWYLAETLSQGNIRSALVGLAVAAAPGLLYVALRWPIVFPLAVYVLLVPFDPLLTFVSSGGTLTKMIGIASVIALALRAVLSRRLLVPPKSWYAWGGFILLMVLSMAWSISVDDSSRPLQIMGSLFALFTAIAIYPITASELRLLRRITIFAGLVTATYGFYAFRATKHVYTPGHKGVERLMLTSGHIEMDPNHYAAFFLIPIAFVVAALLTEQRSWLMRFAYIAMFAMMTAEVLLTGSRGGLLGVAVVVLFLGFRLKRIVATSVVMGCAFAMSLAIPSVWRRFADKTLGDNSGRNEIWSTGVRAFHDFWFVGSGFGTYPEAYDRYLLLSYQRMFNGWHRPAHNLFISIAVEMGVVGLVVLCATLWFTLRQNAKIPRTHALFVDRVGIEAAMLGMFWMSLSIDVLWYKYIWLVLAFNVLLANVYAPRVFHAPAARIKRSRNVGATMAPGRARVRS